MPFFYYLLHKRTCSTKSLAYLATSALVERSDFQDLRSSSRPLQQLLTLHTYFAIAAAIPRRLFFPILCCIVYVVFGVASDTSLVSFSLLFGERNRPAMFLLQELNVNELLNSILNISKKLHARVINMTNTTYCLGFISQVR